MPCSVGVRVPLLRAFAPRRTSFFLAHVMAARVAEKMRKGAFDLSDLATSSCR